MGDGRVPPTPEQIREAWDAIDDMDAAKESANATAALGDMLAAFSPPAKEEVPSSGALTVKAVFDRMTERFQVDKAAGVDVVFQFRITGPGGGEWHVRIKDGTCEVREGVHEKPTTTIIMGVQDFLSMIQGKLKAMLAYTSGKLKIEGDLIKSQLIEKLFTFA